MSCGSSLHVVLVEPLGIGTSAVLGNHNARPAWRAEQIEHYARSVKAPTLPASVRRPSHRGPRRSSSTFWMNEIVARTGVVKCSFGSFHWSLDGDGHDGDGISLSR